MDLYSLLGVQGVAVVVRQCRLRNTYLGMSVDMDHLV